MRELKFRAWYAPEKEYIYDVQATYDNACEGKGSIYHENFREVLEDDDCTVEQYTGLKDENGKEIYEGDIVTLNGEWEEIEHGDCSIVTFENGCFRVGNGYENEAGSYLSDWRIIGNIHENPELLKEEKE